MQNSARRHLSGKQTLLVLAGLVLLLVWYSASKPAAPAQNQVPTVESPSQVLGQQRHLVNPSGSAVALVPSKAGLDAAVRSLALNDQAGFRQAMSTSVSVPNGTSVLVIDTDTVEGQPARQVRVLTGQYAGEAGWVLANALAP